MVSVKWMASHRHFWPSIFISARISIYFILSFSLKYLWGVRVCLCAVYTENNVYTMRSQKRMCYHNKIGWNVNQPNVQFKLNWVFIIMTHSTNQPETYNWIGVNRLAWESAAVTAQHSIVEGSTSKCIQAQIGMPKRLLTVAVAFHLLSLSTSTYFSASTNARSLTCTNFSIFVSLLTEKYFPNYSSFCASPIKRWNGKREQNRCQGEYTDFQVNLFNSIAFEIRPNGWMRIHRRRKPKK